MIIVLLYLLYFCGGVSTECTGIKLDQNEIPHEEFNLVDNILGKSMCYFCPF